MKPDQRFGAGILLAGSVLVVISTLMVSVPLGLLVAGALCVVLGTAVLRGSKP